MGWIIGAAIGCIILGLIFNNDILSGCGCGCLSTLLVGVILALVLIVGSFFVNPVLGMFVLIFIILIFLASKGRL